MIERLAFGLFLAVAVAPAPARAADAGPSFDAPMPALARPSPEEDDASAIGSFAPRATTPELQLRRGFSFVPDPSLPAPWQVAGTYAASYAATGGATRPLAALSGRGGLVSELGAELGLHERFALYGAALVAPTSSADGNGQVAGRAALRTLLTAPGSRDFRVGASAGYTRDFAGVSGGFAELTGALDVSRLRFATLVHGEKMASAHRDAADFYAAAGISVRTLDALRVGAEYVGQDFEEAWDATQAEGGVRHFAGLTLAFQPSERVWLVGGPAFGLNANAPRVMGRAALTYLF